MIHRIAPICVTSRVTIWFIPGVTINRVFATFYLHVISLHVRNDRWWYKSYFQLTRNFRPYNWRMSKPTKLTDIEHIDYCRCGIFRQKWALSIGNVRCIEPPLVALWRFLHSNDFISYCICITCFTAELCKLLERRNSTFVRCPLAATVPMQPSRGKMCEYLRLT